MGNGMTERFNQTLLQMLGTLDDDQKSDWKLYVAPICHAYNVTIHSSTGFSTYYIMFGRHPRLAIDSLLGVNVDDLHARHNTSTRGSCMTVFITPTRKRGKSHWNV